MMNDEGQDSKTVYSIARIDFCSKYISFALLKLLSCSLTNVQELKKIIHNPTLVVYFYPQ